MKICIRKPDHELNTLELISRIKSKCDDAQTAYGLFVKARNLKPEISMKEFKKYLESVTPDEYIEKKEIDYIPTHKSKEVENMTIMIVSYEVGYIRYITSYGSTGSSPTAIFEQSYEKI